MSVLNQSTFCYETKKTQREQCQEKLQEYLKFKKGNPFDIIAQKFYYYLAFNNLWKFIDRKKLLEEDIKIMKELNIYKPTRKELGIPKQPTYNRVFLDKGIYYSRHAGRIYDFSQKVNIKT